MRLILGSQSPRRKEILEFFNLPFEQASSQFAEDLVPFEGDPMHYAKTLSEGKGDSLRHHYPKAVILTADTVVFKEGKVYGKPKSEEEALSILKELSGSWHSVFTAVTATVGKKQVTEWEETRVLFHPLTPDELIFYHRAFHGLDKAGGYGIQKGGSVIVKKIDGCFYNVMGMPIGTLRSVLLQAGIDVWHYLKLS